MPFNLVKFATYYAKTGKFFLEYKYEVWGSGRPSSIVDRATSLWLFVCVQLPRGVVLRLLL